MASSSDSSSDRFVRKISFKNENVAIEWKQFKDEFKIYRIAKGIDKLTEDEKIANMLMLMGPESVPIYEQFAFNDSTHKKTLETTTGFFDDYFEPVKNVIYERAVFNDMKQASGQSIHAFIVSVQAQAKLCDYGTMCDELVRDRIVVGVHDDKLRQYLYDVEDLTLTKCIQKAKQYVSHHEQAAKINQQLQEEGNIDIVNRGPARGKQTGANTRTSYGDKYGIYNKGQRQQDVKLKSRCRQCGKDYHRRGNCPALKSICHDCKQQGHWAKTLACKYRGKPLHEIEQLTYGTEEQLEGLFLGSDSD